MQRGSVHIFALVGVLVLVLVAVEVFYFSKAKPVKNLQKAVDTSAGVVVSSPASEKQEPEADGFLQIPPITTTTVAKQPEFNDYSNSGLGFKFGYDLSLSVKEDSEEQFNQRGNGNFRKNFTGYVGYEPPKPLGAVAVLDKDLSFDKNSFSVWVFDNSDGLTTDKWFDKYWYYPFVWGVFDYTSKGHIALDKEATISGQIAKYKIVSYQPGSPKFVYVSKGGKMYLFRIIGEAGEKILSGFKFLQ